VRATSIEVSDAEVELRQLVFWERTGETQIARIFTKLKPQRTHGTQRGTPEGGQSIETSRKTAIERHIKVKGEANPYDPRYTEYFERRRSFMGRVLYSGRKTGQAKPAGV
jgi:hypothetical protein